MAILGAVQVSIGLDLPVSSVKIDHKKFLLHFFYVYLCSLTGKADADSSKNWTPFYSPHRKSVSREISIRYLTAHRNIRTF